MTIQMFDCIASSQYLFVGRGVVLVEFIQMFCYCPRTFYLMYECLKSWAFTSYRKRQRVVCLRRFFGICLAFHDAVGMSGCMVLMVNWLVNYKNILKNAIVD
jgi:hypothetical protein